MTAVLRDLVGQAQPDLRWEPSKTMGESDIVEYAGKLRDWVIGETETVFAQKQDLRDRFELHIPLCYCVLKRSKNPERRDRLHKLIGLVVDQVPELLFFELDVEAVARSDEQAALRHIGGIDRK